MFCQDENLNEFDEEIITERTPPAANIDNYQYQMLGVAIVLLIYFLLDTTD